MPGANFSVGDGHGVQGDGEVCVTALEMCLTGTFTFMLHKGAAVAPLLRMPRAETPTHFISMGLNEDLDQAMKQALREMIAFICARTNLSREQAYQFCSLAVDFHVTQTVNGEKGVHGMLRKGPAVLTFCRHGRRRARPGGLRLREERFHTENTEDHREPPRKNLLRFARSAFSFPLWFSVVLGVLCVEP